MISLWLAAALSRARYEILDDDEGFFGEIPECRIVLASGKTFEDCRRDLRSALEDWLVFRLQGGFEVPEFDGVNVAHLAHPVMVKGTDTITIPSGEGDGEIGAGVLRRLISNAGITPEEWTA